MAKRKQKQPKLTPNQLAWNREVKRIKSFLRRATKRGYEFDKFVLPSKPARITKKQLSALKDITPNYLYSIATHKVPATDKTVSGTEYRAMERRVAYAKGEATKARKRALQERMSFIEQVKNEVAAAERKTVVTPENVVVDEETGEVLFELDETPVASTSLIIENVKAIFESVDAGNSPYLIPLLDWFNEMVKKLGADKVAEVLQEIKYYNADFLYIAVKYEESAVSFVTRHMVEFVKRGWIDRDEANEMIEDITAAGEVWSEGL